MVERSLFWDGNAVLGDDGPYTSQDVQDRFFRSILGSTGDYGVARGWRNELEVTGTSSPVSIDTGGGAVYGTVFDLDVATSIAIPTPSSGNGRYDWIVARKTWADQTVRIARNAQAEGAIPVYLPVTQTVNVVWEIPLALLLTTDAGVITVTDAREFLAFPTAYAANIVTAGMFAEGAVTADQRPNRTRSRFANLKADSGAPCTRTAGAYDYWSFADAAFNRGWAFFMETGTVGSSVNFYVWSVPHVNGAGVGVENAQWDYWIHVKDATGGTPVASAGTTNVDQQLRVNTTVYRDQIAAGITVDDGSLVAFRLSRDGAADSYNSAMRVFGVEMEWTANA